MGGSPPPPPTAPPPPPPPNYAAANREAIQADMDTLPDRKRIEQAAKLGQKVKLSNGQEIDFSGLGDSQLASEQARVNAQTADLTAQSVLDIQRKYGSLFNQEALKRLQEADPQGYAARQGLAKTLQDDLNLGSNLTPQEQQQTQQQIRMGQAARGNILGNAATSQEALGQYELGQKLRQQRLANISSYVFGTPLTAQYQNLSGAQNQAAPYQPAAYQPGIGLNPGAGAQGTQFASSIYGNQMGAYGTGLGYGSSIYGTNAGIPNPWMQGLGLAGGIASGLGSAALRRS